MSKKDCGNHDSFWSCGCGCKYKKYKKFLAALAIFIIIILVIFLIIWLVLRPNKPKYYLQDATIYNLNLTGPTFLSTTMQVTLKSHNPNDKIGIYYDKLDVYAMYKGQQITIPTELPPGYQGHDDINIWSPYLTGTDVPLAQYLCVSLNQDETAGYLMINVRIGGRLRWKVGSWISGRYHIDVNCPAFLTVNGEGTEGNGRGYRFNPIAECNVDV